MSEGVVFSMRTSFRGSVRPSTTVTSRLRNPSAAARNLMSSALALPFSGGAATATLRRPSRSPAQRVRDAPGTTLMGRMMAPSVVVSWIMSELYWKQGGDQSWLRGTASITCWGGGDMCRLVRARGESRGALVWGHASQRDSSLRPK